MCIGMGAPSGQMAMPPPLPAPPAPAPTTVDPSVVRAGEDQKRRAAAAGGYNSTITNAGGPAGLLTPAFTAGSPGFKALTGQ